jgi:DNA-binding NarL/FixJ family response regulator
MIEAGNSRDDLDDKITVAILEDHGNEREGYELLVAKHTEKIVCVGVAAMVQPFLELIDRLQPDVAIVDLRINGDYKSGMSAIPGVILASPMTRILVFTGSDDPRHFREALMLGAHGYLLKSEKAIPLHEAIRTVYERKPVWPEDMLRSLIKLVPDDSLDVSKLELKRIDNKATMPSKREMEVLVLFEQDSTRSVIADRLNIEQATVNQHLKNLRKKWNVNRSEHLALYARANFQQELAEAEKRLASGNVDQSAK